MYMTNFAKIGKAFLRSITGVQQNFKEIKRVEVIDTSICKKCPFNNSNADIIQQYCKNYCQKAKTTKKIVTYYNESNRYHIPKRERLSKSQIKQILLYHFLGVDKRGIVKNISTKKVAKLLGCTTRTVKNNNQRFIDLGYILYSKAFDDKFSILLTDYSKYHLTKKEGGTGYITMSKELLFELLKIDSVNSLRLELRKTIEFDDSNINTNLPRFGEYTYNEIKRFLPEYLHYKRAVNNVIENCSNCYDVIQDEKGIKFMLKDKYNPDILIDNIYEECEKNLYIHPITKSLYVNEEVQNNLYDLCIRYGIQTVNSALDYIYYNYVIKRIKITNIVGLARTIITRNAVS